MSGRRRFFACLWVLLLASAPVGTQRSPSGDAPSTAVRLHGSIEPVRSHPVAAPRLTGSATGPLVIVQLAHPGTFVRRGDLLIEFDRQAPLKAAKDRQADYLDLVEQINKKSGEHLTARAHDDTALKAAENTVKSAELDMLDQELVSRIVAERHQLALDEARARLAQLRRTYDLKRRAEAADVRILEVERDRAHNAWRHAEQNAERMRITSPLDGLVVLKSTWKNGSMGEVQEGEEVRPGISILDVVDPSAMRVRARVNQADIDQVQTGQMARITLDSYPAREFRGRLEQLSPIGSTSMLSNRVRSFIAIFSIEGTDPHLQPDLAAAIDLAPATVPARGAMTRR
jgi:multidrug resistance efflux pump